MYHPINDLFKVSAFTGTLTPCDRLVSSVSLRGFLPNHLPGVVASAALVFLQFSHAVGAAPLAAEKRAAKASQNISETKLKPVPFVGCPADGQMGPINAPKQSGKALQLAEKAAQHLAYFQAENCLGVLAPQGWHGFGTYGSNGSVFYVTPKPIKKDDVFSGHWTISGPAIQVYTRCGDTSGRWDVANIIARIFPSQKAFVKKVIDFNRELKIKPADHFPKGPYPKDRLTHRKLNDDFEIVEYQTPAHTKGLGTDTMLKENANEIDGVAIISTDSETPNLYFMALRLPPEAKDLRSTIIQQFEKEITEDR